MRCSLFITSLSIQFNPTLLAATLIIYYLSMTLTNTETDNNEWTFVKCKKKTRPQKGKIHDCQKKRDRQVSQAIHLQSSILSHESSPHEIHPSNMKESLEEIINMIENCKMEMKSFGRRKKQDCSSCSCSYTTNLLFDIQAIINSIQQACTVQDDHNPKSSSRSCKKSRQICEIICYGIGNFSHSRSHNYNAPLIQLVCMLLLRENLATQRTAHPGPQHEQDTQTSSSDHGNCMELKCEVLPNNHCRQQELVPIYYFEPLLQPVEAQVLKYYHVKVLDVNEQGKHSISQENTDNHHQEENDDNNSCTLFYMPHCPMRLYSNVLWANWKKDLILNGRIIIFGNSFHAYDDRIISSQKKKDDTNAIFPLLPFLSEVGVLFPSLPTGSKTNKQNGKRFCHECMTRANVLTEQDLELSFNDCAIISFSAANALGKDVGFPPKPEEYNSDKDGDDGELL